MIILKDGNMQAVGSIEDIVAETACIVCSVGESIKGMKNCTEEQKKEYLQKFEAAMYLATFNPGDELKPQGVVIEI